MKEIYLLTITRWFRKKGEIIFVPNIRMKEYIAFDDFYLAKDFISIDKIKFNKDMVITNESEKNGILNHYYTTVNGYYKPKKDEITFEISYGIMKIDFISKED